VNNYQTQITISVANNTKDILLNTENALKIIIE